MEALEVRVAVVEEKQKDLSSDMKELKETTKEIVGVVNNLHVKVVQQNGAIPHLSESIKDLSVSQKEMMQKQEKILDRINKDAVKTSTLGTKLKIMWSILALGTGALVTQLIHHLTSK